MQAIVVTVIVGLIGGISVGFQVPLVSLMSQRIGIMESTFIVHLGGTIFSGVLLVTVRGGNLSAWQSVPWYALVAGIFGLVVVAASSYTIPRLGVASLVTLLVVGQLIIGVLLDHFGLLGATVRALDLSRVVGIVVLFAGLWLILR